MREYCQFDRPMYIYLLYIQYSTGIWNRTVHTSPILQANELLSGNGKKHCHVLPTSVCIDLTQIHCILKLELFFSGPPYY